MKELVMTIALMLAAGNATAQGYFDFGQIPGIVEQPTVQIDLNPTSLAFVTAAARAADPASGELIAGIENVRVRVYQTTDGVDELLGFIDDASGQLESDGWQRTVYVDDHGSKVRIYMKFENDNATGITVMVAGEGDDAVFVNVAGLIDPAKLGQLMNTIGAGRALQDITGLNGAAATEDD